MNAPTALPRVRGLRQVTQPRRGLSREEAAVYVGVGVTKFDEMVADGRMPRPKTIDSRRVWDVHRLDLAFDALPDGDEGAGQQSSSSSWD